jgi:hypothetical protein
MEVTQGQHHLCAVKLGCFFSKALDLVQVGKKFTTLDERHHKENLVISLEDIHETDKERVVYTFHDLFFQLDARVSLTINDLLLIKRLHGVDLTCRALLIVELLDQKDLSICASPDDLFDFEVAQSYVLVLRYGRVH